MRYQERDEAKERREHHELHMDEPWYEPEHQPDSPRPKHFHLYGVRRHLEDQQHIEGFHLYGIGPREDGE